MSSKKSPMSSIAIMGVALVLFVAALAIGVSMLGKDKPTVTDPDDSSSISESSDETSSESSQDSSESSDSSSSTSTSGSTSTSTSGSTSVSTSGSSSSSQPAATNTPFDPAKMGASGFANIANSQKINTDVKGWLKIPGTNIDYPILHDGRILPAPEYHYYLARDINKKASKDGVVYADPDVFFGNRASISSNTVLYGHNWTNYSANPRIGNSSDVMFAQLTGYHHLDFAKNHPYIYYSTASEEMVWQVFATFYTDINFYYNLPNPASEAEMAYIIDGAKSRSRHNFATTVAPSDKILTLSTCTRAYGQSDKQRFVVMAKLMPKGAEIKAVNVTTNPNPVLPKL